MQLQSSNCTHSRDRNLFSLAHSSSDGIGGAGDLGHIPLSQYMALASMKILLCHPAAGHTPANGYLLKQHLIHIQITIQIKLEAHTTAVRADSWTF